MAIPSAELAALQPVAIDTSAGSFLRSDIDGRYRILQVTGQLVLAGKGRNWITDLVAVAVPWGTPEREARTILRAAGFAVGRRGEHPLHPEGIHAVIDPYDSFDFGKSVVSAVLQLKGRDGDARVAGIEAAIDVLVL